MVTQFRGAADGVFVDTGCGQDLFCPHEPIQRWVMAVWLIRALDQDPPPQACPVSAT